MCSPFFLAAGSSPSYGDESYLAVIQGAWDFGAGSIPSDDRGVHI